MGQELTDVFGGSHRSLLKVDDDQFLDINVSLVKEAVDRDITVIYVAAREPYLLLRDRLEEEGVELTEVHFVDCIIKTITNKKLPEQDGVIYLKRTDALRNISTAVSAEANTVQHRDILLIIDSLKALLVSHTAKEVARFLDDIRERLNTMEMNLVLFDEGREVENLIGKEIYNAVDNVLFLRGVER